MAINKIVFDGNTLIDLTSDTVTANVLMEGYTAHDRTGTLITGTGTGGGVDGDNLAYGLSLVGSAIVGSSVIS